MSNICIDMLYLPVCTLLVTRSWTGVSSKVFSPRRPTTYWEVVASRSVKRSFSSVWHLWDHIWITVSGLGIPSERKLWTYQSELSSGQQPTQEAGAHSMQTRGRWMGFLRLKRKMLRRDIISVFHDLLHGYREDRVKLFSEQKDKKQ